MNFIKKQSVWGWVLLGSAISALIGFIIYMVSDTTGYLAGNHVNAATIILPIAAILLAGVVFAISEKLEKVKGVMVLVAGLCVAITMGVQVYCHHSVFADAWFIPVNYPEAEDVTVAQTIASVVFYAISMIGFVVACMKDNYTKEA